MMKRRLVKATQMLLTVRANMLEHDAVAMKRGLSRVVCHTSRQAVFFE
jgi:hypothetical protein